MYQQSVSDPEGFWGEHGKIVDWIKPFTQVKNTSFDPGHIDIRWFEDVTLNVSANCNDRSPWLSAVMKSLSSGKAMTLLMIKTLTFNELHKRSVPVF